MTVVVHDNVEKLGFSFVGDEIIFHFEHTWMTEHFQNLKLPVFIFLIL